MSEFKTVNPATGAIGFRPDLLGADELRRLLDQAAAAYEGWSARLIEDRCGFALKAASLLEQKEAELSMIISMEMGKPVRESVAEVRKCALLCRYYAENAAGHLADQELESDASRSWVSYEPAGLVLGIMPWNFPLWQVFRYAIPSMIAGNVSVLKHAPNVPGCALAIEGLLREAGLPEGVFNNAFIPLELVEDVVAHPLCCGVSLTGSDRAGRAVAALAGKYLRKCVLELGGSDPFIIFADADFKPALRSAWLSRMMNTGQSCIAAKRILVEQSRFEEAAEYFSVQLQKLRIGDPLDPSTDIGPLARKDLAEELNEQLERSLFPDLRYEQREDIPLTGAFVRPTVVFDPPADSPLLREEIFGPVLSLVPFKDEAEALRIANDTRFGLGASVWTADTERAARITKGIQSGNVYLNSMVRSDPRLPFGGSRDSGYGKELGAAGIREFCLVKTNYWA